MRQCCSFSSHSGCQIRDWSLGKKFHWCTGTPLSPLSFSLFLWCLSHRRSLAAGNSPALIVMMNSCCWRWCWGRSEKVVSLTHFTLSQWIFWTLSFSLISFLPFAIRQSLKKRAPQKDEQNCASALWWWWWCRWCFQRIWFTATWGRRCLLFLGELEVLPLLLLLLPKKLAFAKQNSARYWLAMKAQERQSFYFYFCRRCQSSSSSSPLIEFANLINRHNRRVTDAPLLLLLPSSLSSAFISISILTASVHFSLSFFFQLCLGSSSR